MERTLPPIWWSPSCDGVYVRSQHGGFKKVATGYGYAWSSDGADGYRDELPADAQLLTPEGS